MLALRGDTLNSVPSPSLWRQGKVSPLLPPTGLFDLKLWPGSPLPIPQVMSVPEVQIDNDFIFSYENPGNCVEFPEEFILREALDLDPNDLEQAANIYESYGVLF